MVRVAVGRMDNMQTVEVEENSTINQAFSRAGIAKAENEVIQDLESTEFNGSEEIVSGTSYILVQRVKSGC